MIHTTAVSQNGHTGVHNDKFSQLDRTPTGNKHMDRHRGIAYTALAHSHVVW